MRKVAISNSSDGEVDGGTSIANVDGGKLRAEAALVGAETLSTRVDA